MARIISRMALAWCAVSSARSIGAQGASPYERAALTIDGSRIRAHIAVFADDALEGRGTGTRGYDSAAKYVATQFAAAGLHPCCGGPWTQQVQLTRRDVDPRRTELTLIHGGGSTKALTIGSDFVLTRPGRADWRIDGPVVFVGYGLTIARIGHDDYSGIDVHGKVVAYVPGAPPELSIDERAYHEDSKIQNANSHGAVATLRIWTPKEASTETWANAVQSYAAAGLFTWELDPGRPGSTQVGTEHAWLGPAASEALFDGAPLTYSRATETPSPAILRTRIRLSVHGTVTAATSPNVISVLRGSDSVLAREFVVVSAHLDHLGIGTPVNGDSIYNGAVDNASGVAALLELARAFSRAPERPRRSLMFVAFAGEEAGDLGSQFFVQHPPVPLSAIVADVNIDGISVWPFDGIVPRGAEHSTLAGAIDAAARTARIQVAPEPVRGRYWIGGSDQYSFMTAGVPSVIVGSARSGVARELALSWTRDRYHAPSDDMAQPLDMEAAAMFTRDLMAILYGIANDSKRPAWNPGDFFGTLRRP